MSLMGRDFIIWYTGSYFPNIHHNLRTQTLSCPVRREDNQSWTKFYKETFHPSYLDCVPLTGDQTLPIWPAGKPFIESSSEAETQKVYRHLMILVVRILYVDVKVDLTVIGQYLFLILIRVGGWQFLSHPFLKLWARRDEGGELSSS